MQVRVGAERRVPDAGQLVQVVGRVGGQFAIPDRGGRVVAGTVVSVRFLRVPANRRRAARWMASHWATRWLVLIGRRLRAGLKADMNLSFDVVEESSAALSKAS